MQPWKFAFCVGIIYKISIYIIYQNITGKKVCSRKIKPPLRHMSYIHSGTLSVYCDSYIWVADERVTVLVSDLVISTY